MNWAKRTSGACATWSMVLLAGCRSVFSPFVPDTRTPADRARELEAKCKWVTDDDARVLLDPTAVERVDPELSYVQSGNDRRPNLIGARVYLRPLPGLSSPEHITRTLECHQARAALALVHVSNSDPYVLPDRWLDLDAISSEDAFAVRIRVDDLADARTVLSRARHFAAEGL